MAKKRNFQFAYELRETAEKDEAEIMIYSRIVSQKWYKDDPDVTAAEFDKLLKEAEKSGATKLRLRVNSPGGSVNQAVAMKNMVELSSFEEIHVDIEGLCASAATFFVCIAGAKVRIAEGSEFMIHNPSVWSGGTAKDLRKDAQRLEKMENDQHTMYAKRTGQTEDQIKQWMDEETWFTAKETVENGFADEVIQAADAVACVDQEDMDVMAEMYEHIPERIGIRGRQEPQKEVRNEGRSGNGGPAAEYQTSNKEGNKEMDVKDITAQQLLEGNPELYNSLIHQGAATERTRIQEIEEMTDQGFEQLAKEAKDNGTSSAEFLKQVVAARKDRRGKHMEKRQEELKGANQITGGASGDNDGLTEEQRIQQHAKDMAEIAADLYAESGGMY